MPTRTRILAFGSAGLLIVGGIVCSAVLSGGVGPYLAFGLIGVGLMAVVSLVFFEVGLSEDRALEREEKARRRRLVGQRPRPRPTKLGRSRGQRRRLG